MIWPKFKPSLTHWLLAIIAIAVLFNLLFSFLMLATSGTFKLNRMDAYENFAATVLQDADRISILVGKDAVNGVILANNIDQRIERSARRVDLPTLDFVNTPDGAEEALELAISHIRVNLAAYYFSGAFFILMDGSSDIRAEWPGVILRDAEDSGGHSLVLTRGPSAVARKLGLSVAPDAVETVAIPPGKAEFLDRILGRQYYHSTALRADGYWTRPLDLHGTGEKSVYFVVPLIDEENRPYAVLGLELSVRHIAQSILPPDGGRYDTVSYLVPLAAPERAPDWFITPNPIRREDGSDITDRWPDSIFSIMGDRVAIGQYEVPDGMSGEAYVSAYRDLKLYVPSSPFQQEGWALLGFAKRSLVLAGYDNMLRRIAFSILLASALAAVVIYGIVKYHINRIADANRVLHDTPANDDLVFQKVDIEEIDSLTDGLEEMHQNLRESAFRVAAIFDMLETPMACYEHRIDRSDRVFVTPSLYGMLGMVDRSPGSMYVNPGQWAEIYGRLFAMPCQGTPNTYKWTTDAGVAKYLRVEEVRREGYVIGILTDVTGQVAQTRELHRRASYDELTKLLNRHSFRQEALRRIEREPRKKGVMLFGDLDGLKQVNDEYGHGAGDCFIQLAADAMRELEHCGGIAARLSGDEFAAYFHGFDTVEQARTVLYSCLAKTTRPVLQLPDGTERPVSMSRGIAVYPDDSGEFSALLACADRAMYQAKYSHKGSVVEYGKCAELDNETLHHLQTELLRMVKEHRFYYVYQPVVDARTRDVVAYATYIRPESPELADPRAALETALMMSLQGRIGKLIFEENLAMIRAGSPPAPQRLLIKTMKYSLMGDSEYASLGERYRDEFSRLDIVVPAETVSNGSYVEEKVKLCRRIGARVVFEHFGADEADVTELLDLGPDAIRVQIGWVRDAARNAKWKERLRYLAEECRRRNIELLATEIESEADAVAAVNWGFTRLQGYYFGYPNREFQPPITIRGAQEASERE